MIVTGNWEEAEELDDRTRVGNTPGNREDGPKPTRRLNRMVLKKKKKSQINKDVLKKKKNM